MSSLAMVLQFDPKFLTSIALIVSVVLFILYNDLVVKPKRLRSKLSNQGINGPTPTFMIGNILEIKKAKQLITTTPKSPSLEPIDFHDCASITFPFIETWKQKYGKLFMFSIGTAQILVVNKPEILRDIITCKSLDLGRPSYQMRYLKPLLGQGIITSNGTKWANQRKILAPELYMDKVKLTMVIHETLRLYPSVPVIPKEALEDMELGNIHVPKGVSIWTMCLTAHTDPELWGSDAYKFNPERFANGVSGACKLPHMYMPFGFGVRICLGKDLAMTEMKMMLSLILCNFTFSLSSKYIHSPALKLLLVPQHGVHLLVKKLSTTS